MSHKIGMHTGGIRAFPEVMEVCDGGCYHMYGFWFMCLLFVWTQFVGQPSLCASKLTITAKATKDKVMLYCVACDRLHCRFPMQEANGVYYSLHL
jgi:hypothetical protein